VDTLLNSDEYLENFGFDTVPYQRRRILPQRSGGETPFNLKTPRYGEYHRGQLGFPQVVWQNVVRRFIPQEQQVTAGNPSLYMGMAREISPFVPNIPRVSTTNMNYLALVPKK
jgi:phycobilisome rod-core linker protein